jgi:hypothetical protein
MNTRASIITALDARFKTILTSGGYNTNLGANVKHWQTENINEEDCPALRYSDSVDDEDFATMNQMEHVLPLEIDLKYVVADVSEATDGIEDVYAAIGVDETFGGLLVSATPKGNRLDVDASAQTIIVTAKITIDLTYRTTKWGI